ncbi:PhoH-like ATPase [Lachnospiraceae bacterium A10]|jgi:PhoH-like ATPase|nr:PhoH-like ATPase [Lachnospiraceae bacterium A10]
MTKTKGSIKNYILDTNILLQSPNSIFGFEDNHVVITGTTLQELDHKKTLAGELGYNARETCRILESLRLKGDLTKGVDLGNSQGGKLFIEPDGINKDNLPDGYSIDVPDNRIISACLTLKERSNMPTKLVTNDISMRINASVCGMEVESYRNDQIASKDELYTGKSVVQTNGNLINQLYRDKKIEDIVSLRSEFTPLEGTMDPEKLFTTENEFYMLKSGTQSALCIYRHGDLKLIEEQRAFNVVPRNAAQTFALYALLAPVEEIPFVILRGPAGTAKTFLSIAAGLDGTYDSRKERSYEKVLITRNNITSDADFGYLPGDINEKMSPLLAPFYDNLESILRGKHHNEDNEQVQMQIDDMFFTNVINVCPLAYMRGRSISQSYLIVDEAQNSTRSQMRDIITRAGKGTKIVICGDINQIDNHTLDRWTNGLVFASEKMKGSDLVAQVTFAEEESVRSALATEALKRLDL